MNFDKAEDRENYHLLTMDRKLLSMSAVNEAQGRLYRMFARGIIDKTKYAEVREWIADQLTGLAQWRGKHPRYRHPIDPLIEPQNLTANQRRRLAAQRKEPGTGGQ